MNKGAVDIVQTDATWTGGISEFMKIAAMAKTMGYDIIPHYSAGAIALIANLHVAAAIGTDWMEMHLRKNDLREYMFKESIQIEDGHLILPEAPGLGYTVREDVLHDYTCKF